MRPILLLLMLPLLIACEGTRQHEAPPREAAHIAQVPGFPDVRFFGDEVPGWAESRFRDYREFLARKIASGSDLPNDGTFDVLLLSGGGSDGAYGAGLLNGWTMRGDRPEFWVVTGISTGALIAPFAFVGPDFDDELERFYTNTRTEDLVTYRFFDALRGQLLGITDRTSLERTVDAALTPELMRRIADGHRQGRRLLIGTTNLDAQRPVVWDIGRIATSYHPDARRLIRDILLASSAIPGAMPPVQIEVEADGARYTEMHVDGGVTRQLFFLPPSLRLDALAGLEGDRFRIGSIYLLRNTKLDPDYTSTEPDIVAITSRSIATLIKFSGVADVRIVEQQARDNGFRLQVTAVPREFEMKEAELFDIDYMRALFDVGYAAAAAGRAWTSTVPFAAVAN